MKAAAISTSGGTALRFLRRGGIRNGQEVLVYGASGGVGTYAVQLARHYGAQVAGVCRTSNLELVKSLGADRVIDYTREDFTAIGQTYDIIFDTVGKISFSHCKNLLKKNGAFLEAVMVLAEIKERWVRLTTGRRVVGSTEGEQKDDLVYLGELVEAGSVKPVIDRRYPLERIADAHRYIDTGHKRGNVVITVGKRTEDNTPASENRRKTGHEHE